MEPVRRIALAKTERKSVSQTAH